MLKHGRFTSPFLELRLYLSLLMISSQGFLSSCQSPKAEEQKRFTSSKLQTRESAQKPSSLELYIYVNEKNSAQELSEWESFLIAHQPFYMNCIYEYGEQMHSSEPLVKFSLTGAELGFKVTQVFSSPKSKQLSICLTTQFSQLTHDKPSLRSETVQILIKSPGASDPELSEKPWSKGIPLNFPDKLQPKKPRLFR